MFSFSWYYCVDFVLYFVLPHPWDLQVLIHQRGANCQFQSKQGQTVFRPLIKREILTSPVLYTKFCARNQCSVLQKKAVKIWNFSSLKHLLKRQNRSRSSITAAIMRILIKIDSLFEFSNYSSRAELNITKAFERTVNIGAFWKECRDWIYAVLSIDL